MSHSVRPHRRQPTRLPRPWDSPGKNTGVGGHFLLQCMKVKSESEVAQLCPTLHYPMDCSPPGSFAHGIFQARVLEWVPLPSPRVYHSSIYICPSNKLYLRNLGFCGLQFEKLNKKLVTVLTLLPVLITQWSPVWRGHV